MSQAECRRCSRTRVRTNRKPRGLSKRPRIVLYYIYDQHSILNVSEKSLVITQIVLLGSIIPANQK